MCTDFANSVANQVGEAAQGSQRQAPVHQESKAQTGARQAPGPQARPLSGALTGAVVTTGTAIYIGNLQWWTTDADLEKLCFKYGQILTLKTFEDKVTGKSKGYVLVHFAAAEAAAACQADLNGYVSGLLAWLSTRYWLLHVKNTVLIAWCSREIDGKPCVVTAAQSPGGRPASSTPVTVASTSSRNAPPVRSAVPAGRGMAQRQAMVCMHPGSACSCFQPCATMKGFTGSLPVIIHMRCRSMAMATAGIQSSLKVPQSKSCIEDLEHHTL